MPGTRRSVDRYLTTVLMTDIVDSTGHAAELGDSAWRELVAQHHRLVRAALRRHAGKELDTAGDGFFAVFDAPAEAIAAALEIVDAVAELGIEIRAGIHTGEVEQAGPKVAGITVPIASRIMALAQPSQVLVSATVRELAAGSTLHFADAGAHALKGLPGEWHVFAVSRDADVAGAVAAAGISAEERRAAAVRRSRSRPIWQRRPRAVALAAVALAAIVVIGGLLVWQPWLPPALAQIDSNSVGIIDPGRGAIVASVPVDARPGGVVVDGGSAWVANTGADTVSQIDTRSATQTRVIDVGRSPVGIAAAAGSIWVANSGERTVTRINEATGRVTGPITVGNGPLALAATQDAIWVANATDSTVSRIEAATGNVTATVPVAAGPVALAVGDEGVWIVSADTASVTHLDSTTGVTLAPPLALSSRPTSIAIGSGAVWVASADGTLTRIDPLANRVTSTIDLGGSATGVVADDKNVWVADRAGYVVRLDAANPSAAQSRVDTANSPSAIALDDGRPWVAAGNSPTAHRGGTLRVVDTVFPALDGSGFSALATLEADGLVVNRRVGGAAGVALLPDLALALPKAADGGLSYTFQLRPGLKYATGEPVVPSDFRRGIERSFTITDPFLQLAAGNFIFTSIKGADACSAPSATAVEQCDLSAGIVADDSAGTVRFVLSRADPDFLFELASPSGYPVPPSISMSAAVDGAFPGTGPYVVTAHDDAHVSLTRNPNFSSWDEEARPDGFPDEIDWIVAPSADDAVAMVERADADYLRLNFNNRPSQAALDRIRSQITSQLHFGANSVTAVTMNTARPPFDSIDVRRAVNLAIDRDYVASLRGGPAAAAVTCQILPPGWPGYEPYCPYTTHPDPGGRWQAPNLDAARQLVQGSGQSGTKVVVGPTLEPLADVRDYLVGVLQELGFDATADTNTDFEHGAEVLAQNTIQIGAWEWLPAKLAPSDFLGQFKCGAPEDTGVTNFCDPAFDAIVGDAQNLQTTDLAAAFDKWAEADRMAVDDASWAPLFNEGSDFVSERVGNYQFHLIYGALLDQMWVQ